MALNVGFPRMQACVVLLLCLTEVHPCSETVKSYYDILNVEPTASDSQIKKFFRRLAVKYHPDRNKSTHAEATFRDIAEAYSVLSDKKKRRLYDRVGHTAYLKTSFDPGDEEHDTHFPFSFSDFFQDFHETPFVDEAHFHWSFLQEAEEEHYSFEGPSFSFYFEDIDDNEEHNH